LNGISDTSDISSAQEYTHQSLLMFSELFCRCNGSFCRHVKS